MCRARSQFLAGHGLFHLPEGCFCLVCCGKATLRGNLELICGLNRHCEMQMKALCLVFRKLGRSLYIASPQADLSISRRAGDTGA